MVRARAAAAGGVEARCLGVRVCGGGYVVVQGGGAEGQPNASP